MITRSQDAYVFFGVVHLLGTGLAIVRGGFLLFVLLLVRAVFFHLLIMFLRMLIMSTVTFGLGLIVAPDIIAKG